MHDYTENDICTIYRNQIEPKEGVEILHQLTGMAHSQITAILIEHGYQLECKPDKNKILLELYKQGLTDTEMSNAALYSINVVRRWREANHLKSNKKPPMLDHETALRLYKKGCKDKAIANKLQCTYSAVQKWRKRHNLPIQEERTDKNAVR